MKPNRFRFRAWDIAEKKMIQCCIDEKGFAFVDGKSGREPIVEGVNAYVMQSTGLLDANGKEIFEGDITRQGDSIGVWQWDQYGFQWMLPSGRAIGPYFLSHQFDRIIGNIHENQELMGGQMCERRM